MTNASPGTMPGTPLDPAIRRFVDTVSADYASYPGLAAMPYPQLREVCERVRAPWALGGPEMANTIEFPVGSVVGPVRIRVHTPVTGKLKPALIYLHGGGWTVFSIDTHDRLMREYAARSECVVVGIDYALAPEAKFPTALHQIVAVVHWLRKHGEELGIRTDRLAMGGDSAGGNLTMAACMSLRDRGHGDAIRAMLLNYAALDVDLSEASRRGYGAPGNMLDADEMDGFWRNYMRGPEDAQDPLLNIARGNVATLPPAFFAIAECDVLAEQNLVMAKRLAAAGVAVESIVYKGATHSFLEAVSISTLSARALSDGAGWLRAVLEL